MGSGWGTHAKKPQLFEQRMGCTCCSSFMLPGSIAVGRPAGCAASAEVPEIPLKAQRFHSAVTKRLHSNGWMLFSMGSDFARRTRIKMAWKRWM